MNTAAPSAPAHRSGLFLLLLSLSAVLGSFTPLARAQISVEVGFEEDQYLAGEPFRAAVRIANFSGRTLKLGQDPLWLQIDIEDSEGRLVSRTTHPPVVEEFELPSSGRATRWVDLIPYFNIASSGRYKIFATVRIPEIPLELTSKPAPINITSGARIWEQTFGLPQSPSAETPPEIRKYSLVQGMNKKRVRLYARVTDPSETRIFRVVPIGPVLSFSEPEVQVDRQGTLHVLWQTSAREFTYVCLNPEGTVILRQTHQPSGGRPCLRVDESNAIVVRASVRLRSVDDVPPSEPVSPPTLQDVTPIPAAPATNPAAAAPVSKKGSKESKKATRKETPK